MKTVQLPNPIKLLVVLLLSITKGITEIVRCPRYCTCYMDTMDNMRTVSCVARRLVNIDLGVPVGVQSLDLSNNSISSIEDRGFQNLGLVEIVKLIMKHNSIRTIGLHSFAGLIHLQSVDLKANNLYQILPWTFHDNSNLKSISLSGNPLGHIISSGPFLDVPSLEVLELNNCNFAHFSEDSFTALPNLRRLDISQNQLIHFDIYTLQFLYNLEELDISKNPWSCNTNLQNLKDFLNSKSSKLVGSSCDSPKTFQENNPVKSEKMISVGVIYPEYDFDNASHDDEGNIEETTNQKETECNCQSESETALFHLDNLILPQKWLILVSFQLGVCTTLFLGYFWTCCTKQKNKTHHFESSIPITPIVTELQSPLILCPERQEDTLQISTELLPGSETPPPSYRELFMTSTS